MPDTLAATLEKAEILTETALPRLVEWGMGALGAIGILIIGWIAARLFSGMTKSMVGRNKFVDPTVKPFVGNIIHYTILIVTVVAAIIQLGVPAASILAVLGAAGLAIGLALQGTLSNIAAGVMLLFLRPMKLGEYISAGDIAGTVNEIGLFTTLMQTVDGLYLSVPNSTLWSATIKNYSRMPQRRIDVLVGIAYDDDIDAGLGVLNKVAEADDRILQDPAPQCMVMSLGDSSVNLNLRCWAKTSEYWDVLFDLNRAVKLAIEAEGLTIPFPQRSLHLETVPSGLLREAQG